MLALLSIFGLLAAMFFPAMLRLRQAASRAQCANNLKQFGIAMHAFHNDNGKLPAAGAGMFDQKKPDSGSWCVHVLPYMEQAALYQALSQGQAANAVVPSFYCPDRRQAQLYNGLPKTDYAGNAGTADDPEKPEKPDGLFVKQATQFKDIKDGLSTTIMLGDKGLRTTEYLSGKGAGDKNSCWVGGTTDTLRSSNGEMRIPVRDVPNEDHDRGFGAVHDAGCNMLFGDGSVHLISYKIEAATFKKLITRDGWELVNNGDF